MASFFCHVEDHTFVADKLGAEDPVLDLVVFFKQYIGTCSVWSAKKCVSLKKICTVSKNWQCRQSLSALNSRVRKSSTCDTVVRLIGVFVSTGDLWWRVLFVVKWVAHCGRGTKFAVFFMH